jgi:LytS/YehU family sensor histidine kinase
VNSEEAQDVIGRLGDLLRYSLDQKNDFITLEQELNFIENYLEIEKARFKDRLSIEYKVSEDSKKVLIAGFILQPIIENAVKHGLSKTNRKCTISIVSDINDEMLCIEVADDGNGSESIVNGIGFENTRQRLQNYYEDNFVFTYGNTVPHGFQVVMRIPIRN